jgi:BirA family biotin operon repressor/biotin-[acetyl-CoA-carboxylase] ligase
MYNWYWFNSKQTLFTSNAPNPISLKQITGKEVDLMELLQQIRQQILLNYTEVLKGNNATIMNQYMNCLYRKNGFYPYKTQTECFEARIKTILPSGEMALEKKDKRFKHTDLRRLNLLFLNY